MRIYITVKPNARQGRIEEIDEAHWKVWVQAPAKQGKANEAVVQAVADHLNIPKSSITLVFGKTGREKIVDVAQYKG